MLVNRKEIYEIFAIECPNCGEQIELESKYMTDLFCPFCNIDIRIVEKDGE